MKLYKAIGYDEDGTTTSLLAVINIMSWMLADLAGEKRPEAMPVVPAPEAERAVRAWEKVVTAADIEWGEPYTKALTKLELSRCVRKAALELYKKCELQASQFIAAVADALAEAEGGGGNDGQTG